MTCKGLYERIRELMRILVLLAGYGHITPVTPQGKIFCVVFCLFGIPICLLTLKSAGELISKLLSGLIVNFEKKLLHTQFVDHVEIKCTILTFGLMVVFLSLGSVMQVLWENWTFLDAFYAWFISFTTVGFGDYIPFDSIIPREDGLLAAMFHLFATFPAIFGLCLVASVIDALFRVFDGDGINKESPYGKEHFRVRANASLEDINIENEIENTNIPSSKRSHSI